MITLPLERILIDFGSAIRFVPDEEALDNVVANVKAEILILLKSKIEELALEGNYLITNDHGEANEAFANDLWRIL